MAEKMVAFKHFSRNSQVPWCVVSGLNQQTLMSHVDAFFCRYQAASLALYDSSVLPTMSTTKKIFQMKSWKFGKAGNVSADEERRIAAIAKIESANGNMKALTTVEILEAAGCAIDKRGLFNAWCEAHDTFEFLTADYVGALASYVAGRARLASSKGEQRQLTVLELGAGSGRLSHFLRRQLRVLSHGNDCPCRVVATDSGGWKLKGAGQLADTEGFIPVEKLAFSNALKKYQPDFVIVSWMPMGQDWSAAIRSTPSVLEYVLIGEADDGSCGDNWKTWGNHSFIAREASGATKEGPVSSPVSVPPYVLDGWTRHNLDISELQLSRFDSEEFVGNSCTVSFRRPSGRSNDGRK
jgi:hypothetical protein